MTSKISPFNIFIHLKKDCMWKHCESIHNIVSRAVSADILWCSHLKTATQRETGTHQDRERNMARHSQREGFLHEWASAKKNMLDGAWCVCLPHANLIMGLFIMRPGLFSTGELEMSACAGWVIHPGAISTSRQRDTGRLQRHCLPSVSLLLSATKKLFAISAEIRVWWWGN